VLGYAPSRLLHEALLITEECCDKWQIREEDAEGIPLLVVQLQTPQRHGARPARRQTRPQMQGSTPTCATSM